MYRIPLSESLFGKEPQVVLQSDEFTVTAFAYPQNIAALKIANSRGFVEVLPLMGQIIWDAVFDGKSLRMHNMFRKPQRGSEIVDTYGCFAFHSGLAAPPLKTRTRCTANFRARRWIKHGWKSMKTASASSANTNTCAASATTIWLRRR